MYIPSMKKMNTTYFMLVFKWLKLQNAFVFASLINFEICYLHIVPIIQRKKIVIVLELVIV